MTAPARRVLMLCDDLQIDRRILHEAHTLADDGCEVLVVGRAGATHPREETDGAVRIERIDGIDAARERQLLRDNARVLDREPQRDEAPMTLEDATRELAFLIRRSAIAVPSYPRWIERRGRIMRNLLKALVWPPMRLYLLRRAFPWLPNAAAYAVYLPTLLLTPRPAAIRWHWMRVKRRVAARLPPRLQSRVLQQLEAWDEAMVHALQSRVCRFIDLDRWELALFERGCHYRPDVVHAHDLPQLRAGSFVARKLGVPLVYDAHELYPSIHTLDRAQRQRLQAIERHFIRHADRVITVNPFIAARMATDYGIDAPTVLLNATDRPDAPVDTRPDTLRRALGLVPGDRVLLFQGWISIGRSIGDLVAAMAQVPAHIHLALLGYGEDVPTLQRMAAAAGVAQRVHFLAAVPQAELMRWVASADAGVIPYQAIDDNHLYCSPNKLFEFIAAGVPIIANDLPYLRAVVADNGFGVVMPLARPADYAAAINAMFDAAAGGEQRFRAALAQRAEPYLWPAQARVLRQVYADLVAPAAAVQTRIAVVPARDDAPDAAAPLRVFHGLHNIAGIASIMARAERALGLDSQAVCHPSPTFAYRADIEVEASTANADILDRFHAHADRFDVFVFHFGGSFSNEMLVDVPLLKRMGKKVICYFHGCDVRDADATVRQYEFSACQVCRPRRCNGNRELALEMATRDADAVWVSTPDLLEFVPGAELFLQPVDLARFPLRDATTAAATDGRVRLAHAPSSGLLKGTEHVLGAVKAIQARGEPLELLLLQGLPHDELRRRIVSADLALDQLLIGSYGMFAVEAMATGVPVICYLREDLRARYPEPPPLLSANPRTVEAEIVGIMHDRDRCQNMAVAARAYVERHHDAAVAARRSVAVYRRLTGVEQGAPVRARASA